jgi:hypothetical protein
MWQPTNHQPLTTSNQPPRVAHGVTNQQHNWYGQLNVVEICLFDTKYPEKLNLQRSHFAKPQIPL